MIKSYVTGITAVVELLLPGRVSAVTVVGITLHVLL